MSSIFPDFSPRYTILTYLHHFYGDACPRDPYDALIHRLLTTLRQDIHYQGQARALRLYSLQPVFYKWTWRFWTLDYRAGDRLVLFIESIQDTPVHHPVSGMQGLISFVQWP